METNAERERVEAKTPEQQLQRVYEQGYHFAPRIAAALVAEARSWLLGQGEQVQVGQQRVLLASARARHGQALGETVTQEVLWTVDAGAADHQVLCEQGTSGLRRVRIQRLLSEAYDQGGLASQEDLARVLQTSVRTIKRDCAQLEREGHWLPTRGRVKAIGRGQTHKAQILRAWLQGQTYDQLVHSTHHTASSIQRYVQGFVQVVRLQQQGYGEAEISQLAQKSPALVREYLAVYAQNDSPACRERLAEQLTRLGQAAGGPKGGQ